MTDAFAIVAPAPGGPEVMTRRDITPPEPGPGEVRIRQTAVGVNYLDVYFRTGLYPWPVERDLILGSEGAGVVEALGEGVTGLAVGDRVAYTIPNGAYATHRLVPAAMLVKVPVTISDEQAAAAMLKGLTVHYLIHDSYSVREGDTVLVHAAAGGVGLILGQWLKARGVRAIGTAGGAEKCALARANGYAEVIDYRAEDFVARVAEITGGAGVQAVYDGVGADTIMGSLDCLARFGTLVSFGQSSGAPDQLRVNHLAKGSLRLTRPTLFHYATRRDWLERAAPALFDMIASGAVQMRIGHRAPLAEAAEVHRALEGRATTGQTVLLP
jgi:NADPH2:quinone reductase